MQARTIERHGTELGRTAILVATVLAGGCGSENPPDFAVRGMAAGVLGPVALELRVDGDSELLEVTRAGMFAFETRLETGVSYTVALVDPDVPCTLRNQTGVIADADTDIELTCTVPALSSVVVSGVAPAVTLVPDTTDYVVEVPLLQQSAMLTAIVAEDSDTLRIAGTQVPSGMPTAELPLSLGDNLVDVMVENALGWQRTYRLNLRRATQVAQYAYGKPSNTGENDEFGCSVALSGDTLVVGACDEDSAATDIGGNQEDDAATDSGAVYVFRREGTTWQQEAYLKASNTGLGDQFGVSLALSGDTLAVGAFDEDSAATGVGGNQEDDAATDSGAVYVFRRAGTTWQQEAYLKASNTGPGDRFGVSVALEGDTLAVGAHDEDGAATGVDGDQNDDSADTGAVYVFHRSGTTWEQAAYVKASNTDAGDSFGHSVGLSGDTLAVGAYREDSTGVDGGQADNFAPDSGAVYVFRRVGTAWQQEAYLKASNTGVDDRFGYSVALSGDILAVGAYREDSAGQGVSGGSRFDNDAADSGAVYVFRREGTTWQQEAYFKSSNAEAYDSFGLRVALSGDILAVGAHFEDSTAQGVDGDQNDENETAPQSGAVYVFRREGTTWQQQAYLKASNTDPSDSFGIALALSGDTLAVAADGEDSAAQGIGGDQGNNVVANSGAVYVFH